MTIAFEVKDCGCYADGSLGFRRARQKLAELLDNIQHPLKQENKELINNLNADPSDDFSEENDAVEVLNQFTDSRCYWTIDEGDLFLVDHNDDFLKETK